MRALNTDESAAAGRSQRLRRHTVWLVATGSPHALGVKNGGRAQTRAVDVSAAECLLPLMLSEPRDQKLPARQVVTGCPHVSCEIFKGR